MSLQEFARDELKRAGLFNEDSDYGGMLGEAVMKMIDVFADEGHSGMSASIAIAAFERVARFEPLTPLTGEADEWFLHDGYGGEPYYQNKRCSRVFKGADGRAYDIEGKVFREPNGSCYCSVDSRVFVTFPYVPTREYVDVPEQSGSNSDGGATWHLGIAAPHKFRFGRPDIIQALFLSSSNRGGAA